MDTQVKDVVAIGGGLMGSAAAWHLAQNGRKVTLLEQQAPGYTYGSSFGKTRIARRPERGHLLFFPQPFRNGNGKARRFSQPRGHVKHTPNG